MNPHARIEDIRWMAATGESLTGAARRLGISRDALEKWAGTHGLRAELEALRRRDPFDHNKPGIAAMRGARWAS